MVYDGLVALVWGFLAVTGLFLFGFVYQISVTLFILSIAIGVFVGILLFAYLTVKMFKAIKTNGAFTPHYIYVLIPFIILIALVVIAEMSELSFLFTLVYGFSAVIPAGFLTRLVTCLSWERNNKTKILATSDLPMKIFTIQKN